MKKQLNNFGYFVSMFMVCWVFWMTPSLLISLYLLEWWEGSVDYATSSALISFVVAFAYGFCGLHEDFDKGDP